MKYDEINIGDTVWSMINNSPEQFEVLRKSSERTSVLGSKKLYPSRFPPIFLLRESIPKTVHSRWPEQLTKTKQELKIKIFGE